MKGTVIVSNHGGRQLDHGDGSMEVLPEIVAAVGTGVIVDGGFARGTDIVKALAAGAKLVGLGRMQCYALAAGGEGGLVRMLELIEDEVRRCLGLLGVTRFAALDGSYLAAAPAVMSTMARVKHAPQQKSVADHAPAFWPAGLRCNSSARIGTPLAQA